MPGRNDGILPRLRQAAEQPVQHINSGADNGAYLDPRDCHHHHAVALTASCTQRSPFGFE